MVQMSPVTKGITKSISNSAIVCCKSLLLLGHHLHLLLLLHLLQLLQAFCN